MNKVLAILSLAVAANAADLQYIDTTAGAGDSGRTGGNKINANFSNIVSGLVTITNPPIVGGLTVNGTIVSSNATLTTVTSTTVSASSLVGTLLTWQTNANFLYVATNGSDTTAVKGRLDRPWLTPSVAVTNMVDGDTMLLLPGRHTITCRYATSTWANAEGGFILSNKSNCKIVGVGATLYTGDYGDMLTLYSCTNTEVAGIRFLSTNPVPTSVVNVAAIYPRGTNDGLSVHDCQFIAIANQGVSSYYRPFYCYNVRIYDNYFERFGTPNAISQLGWADGAAISGIGPNWVIENNNFAHNFRSVEMQSGQFNDFITNVVIRNNTIWRNSSTAIYSESYYWDVHISGNHIYDTISTNTAMDPVGIRCIIGKNWTIANNVIRGSRVTTGTDASSGIFIDRGTNINIVGNVISKLGTDGVAPGFGIIVNTSHPNIAYGITIQNNVVHDLVDYNSAGIQIGYDGKEMANIVVANNTCYNIMGNYGGSPDLRFAPFAFRGGSNILFHGNTAFDTVWPKASKVTRLGAYFGPGVSNVVIGRNLFNGVNGYGISNSIAEGWYFFDPPFATSGSATTDGYFTNQFIW